MKGYYIISLKHTTKHDKFITLWRADNKGYTYYKDSAGIYEDYERGYHDGDSAMPIEVEKLEGLFVQMQDDGLVLLNCKQIWDVLGLKATKNGLTRKEAEPIKS